MDFIQRTVSVFSALLQKIRDVGTLIITRCLPVLDEADESGKIFWIFNW